MRVFQIAKFPKQCVVLFVQNFLRVEDMVEMLMPTQFGAQFVGTAAHGIERGIGHRSQRWSELGRLGGQIGDQVILAGSP